MLFCSINCAHTHACPDTLIERSRFPCVCTQNTSKRRQKRDCTRPKRGKARRLLSSSIGGARLFSFVAFALAPPLLLGLAATRERERERGRRRRRRVFSRFFYIAHQIIVCKSRPPFVRSIERRASSKSSRPTRFFPLERNDERTPPRAICRRRACFRVETRFKRDPPLSGHRRCR